jgi:hypothetical protein
MKIANKMIDEAAKLDACNEVLEWLRKAPRTLAELASEFPQWYLWSMRMDLSRDHVDACAARVPGIALQYASALLTLARLHACKKAIR